MISYVIVYSQGDVVKIYKLNGCTPSSQIKWSTSNRAF